MKLSTGLKLTNLKSFFSQPLVLKIYGNADEPNSANDPVTGELILTFNNKGNGINFIETDTGFDKDLDESWSTFSQIKQEINSSYFRLTTLADHDSDSTTFPRIQGTAGGKVFTTIFKRDELDDDFDYADEDLETQDLLLIEAMYTLPDLYITNQPIQPQQIVTIKAFTIQVN